MYFEIEKLKWNNSFKGLHATGLDGYYRIEFGVTNGLWLTYNSNDDSEYTEYSVSSNEEGMRIAQDHYESRISLHLKKIDFSTIVNIDLVREAHLNGVDVHAQTAARLFRTDIDKITPAQRQIGKKLNFYYLYTNSYPPVENKE